MLKEYCSRRIDAERGTYIPCESQSTTDNDEPQTAVSEKQHCEHDPKEGTRIDPRVVSDATIGLSDGLTVPFALTAGLSALGTTKVVIFGGLAELIAGAISMGLGGYLGAKSELYLDSPSLSTVL